MTIAIDTNIFIYVLEAHANYGPEALALLKAVEKGQIKATASELVYLEMLSSKLLTSRDIEKTKKMISLSGASALQSGAEVFVTNDKQILKSVIRA